MGKIVLLDDLTINQIAAGEVIERPASVVKELVENAIDAGASNVTVEIRNGGISYIRITDDGCGIMPDDMETAFERHATSKIRKAEDLDVVKSMGFRGEALASIAAISKVEMVSKTENDDIGYKIEVEGGKILDKHEEGASKGTTITIKDLFYNTPVRYKFLKKDFTESGYIEDAVTRIAIANPGVAIKLISTGKVVIQTTGSGRLEDVVYAIFGKEIASNIISVDYDYEDIKVTGVIGKPAIARSNRSNQMFFVNNRYIKDKTLSSATAEGFKGVIEAGKHAFVILNLEMDCRKVDVNVHPTKLEVRFQDEGQVFRAVYNSIKHGLLKTEASMELKYQTPNDILKGINEKENPWSLNKSVPKTADVKSSASALDSDTRKKFIEELTKSKTPEEIESKLADITKAYFEPKTQTPNESKQDETKAPETEEAKVQEEVKPEENTEIKLNDKIEDTHTEVEEIKTAEDTIQVPTIESLNVEKSEEIKPENKIEVFSEKIMEEAKEKEEKADKEETFEEMYKRLFGRDIAEAKEEYANKVAEENEQYKTAPITGEEISMFETEGLASNANYKYMGIAFNTYIILAMENDLYILDEKAAQEKLVYEKLRQNFYGKGEKDSQAMLLPDVMKLTSKQMGIFKDTNELFNKAGFYAEEFGEDSVKLTNVPDFCQELETEKIFMNTLEELNTVARIDKEGLEDKFLEEMSRFVAEQLPNIFDKDEVDSLMKDLLRYPDPFTDAFGKAIAIKMSKADIEKKFSRRK